MATLQVPVEVCNSWLQAFQCAVALIRRQGRKILEVQLSPTFLFSSFNFACSTYFELMCNLPLFVLSWRLHTHMQRPGLVLLEESMIQIKTSDNEFQSSFLSICDLLLPNGHPKGGRRQQLLGFFFLLFGCTCIVSLTSKWKFTCISDNYIFYKNSFLEEMKIVPHNHGVTTCLHEPQCQSSIGCIIIFFFWCVCLERKLIAT